MRAMKDSGVPWIGEIPETWNVNMLSSLFDEHKQKNKDLSETNLLSLSYGKIIRKDINTKEGLLPESFDGYNIISDGDIVFRLTDLQNDKRSLRTGLCLEKGIITSAYVTIRARQKLYSPYYHYLVHSYDVCKVFYGMGDGVRQGMNYSDLRKLLLVSPSYSEQQKIAEFLDRKCAEVDEMIGLQEQIIEELKAYKQSVITEAVTKGLNPAAPMRDSGIEWIGSIPEHWEVELIGNRIKEHCNPNVGEVERNALQFKAGNIIPKSVGGSIYVPNTLEAYNIVDKGIVMLNGLNLTFDFVTQRVALVKGRGVITSTYLALQPQNGISSEYLTYLFKSYDTCKAFHSMGRGLRQTLSYNELRKYLVICPPITEQQAIADYLDEKCADIDSLIQTKQEKIDSLKEYKKSIIYEYVTGKREVNE